MNSPLFVMLSDFLKKDTRSFISTDGSVSIEEIRTWFGDTIEIREFIEPEVRTGIGQHLFGLLYPETAITSDEDCAVPPPVIYVYNEETTDAYVCMGISSFAKTVVNLSRFVDEDAKGYTYLNAVFTKARGYEINKHPLTLTMELGYGK